MKPNMLLNEDYHYKWGILQVLEYKKNDFYTLGQLMEVTGISKYKISKYLEEIVDEFSDIDIVVNISVEPGNIIVTKGLDNLILKKIRLYYLENSLNFQILESIFYEVTQSDEKLSKKLIIGRNQLYKRIREVNKFLDDVNLRIDNLKIVGAEQDIRSTFFSLYDEFYTGLKLPFNDDISKLVNKFVSGFSLMEKVNLPKTQEFKFSIYTGVAQIRIINNHFLSSSPIEINFAEAKRYKDILHFPLTASEDEINDEISSLLYYSQVENFFGEVRWNKANSADNDIMNLVEGITGEFVANIKNKFEFINPMELETIQNSLSMVNQKWLYFHFKETTFISDNSFSYLQELYPEYDKLIREFFDRKDISKLFATSDEEVNVYYSYIFILINNIPINQVGESVYICVDFSKGTEYNKFIKNSIDSFRDLNIIFEEYVSKRTNLYVSDYVSDKLRCKQIIWKNPPGPSDWKELGDVLIGIKHGLI